jgi:hypothetical protein
MRTRILPILLRAPEGADGGAPPAAPPAAAPPAAAAPELPSIFDDVTAPGAPPGATPPAAGDPTAGKPARPDSIPEQFWDTEKGEVKLDALGKSWLDLRTKIARGEGKLPDTPDAYTLPALEGIQVADLVPAADPLWTETRQAAHKAGVTDAQLQEVMKPYLGALAKVRANAAPAQDAEAIKAAHLAEIENERAKLGPNGRAIVQDIGQWIAGLETRGALSAAEARALKAVGTADGIRALAKIREATGHHAIPTDAMAQDSMTEADARRLMTEGFAQNDVDKQKRARAALEDLQRKGRLGNSRAA